MKPLVKGGVPPARGAPFFFKGWGEPPKRAACVLPPGSYMITFRSVEGTERTLRFVKV